MIDIVVKNLAQMEHHLRQILSSIKGTDMITHISSLLEHCQGIIDAHGEYLN
jgi:hypothetical protein